MVSRDVAPCEMVGAVPARHLKWRFTEQQAEAVQAIAWWDREHQRPTAALPDFRAMPIDGFIEKYR